mmetsp:Transcript_4551/g.6457  ORF Transcript_4551/g.6457 Transcript_4551/m.6457 type:complete len:186 (+) Transcript_4551:54-611(+)
MTSEDASIRQRLVDRHKDIERSSSTENKSTLPPQDMGAIPPNHPFNILYRISVLGGSLWGLHFMKVFHAIIHGVKVNHTIFKIGMAASIAIQCIKGYMELYEGQLKKKRVEYKNYKTATHVTIILILVASLAFHLALWPEYGFQTLLVMFLFGYGILLQILLLIPTYIQNPITIVAMTYFLQQYN